MRIALISAFVLVACSAPASAPVLVAVDYDLPGDARISVSATGAIAIAVGGLPRGGLAIEGSRAITARTFTSSVREVQGSFAFTRSAETSFVASRFLGSERDGDVVRALYEGDGVSAEVTVEAEGAQATRLRVVVSGVDASSVAIPFTCDDDASFMSFGAQYDQTDHRGEAFALYVEEQGIGRTGGEPPPVIAGGRHTTYYPMPYWLDARGFGVWVRTSARTLVDLCARDERAAWVEVESGAALEVMVLHGPRPLDVVRQLGAALGAPARPPEWAFERPWVAIQGGQDAVLAEADALAAAGVPVGALWAQDWSGRREFAPGRFGVAWRWVPDTTLYPDVRAMTDALHARGVRFLAYANPFVVMGLDHFDAMASMDLLVRGSDGAPLVFRAINSDVSLPDFTRPETYAYVEGYLRAMVTDYGIDGWMADYGEWLPTSASLADGSDPRVAHDEYPAAWHAASRRALSAARPDGDFVMFSRSGWAGDQASSQIVWIGDQETDFSETDGLPTVVPALLGLGLGAVPYVTLDIGGFSGATPRTKEAFLRWVELGALTPFMRTHEGLRREDNWGWRSDDETRDHFARFARIHEALAPEMIALVDEAQASSTPLVRHLVLEFPDDPMSRRISDQYMLGSALLVAPIVREGEVRRRVYLPAGTWFHVWSGERHEGPGEIEVDAPIGSPPLFSRGVDRPELRAIR